MQPEEALKQVQCVANTALDDIGERVAPMYGPTFRRVAAEGTGTDVTHLADQLCAELRAGNRPNVDEAEGFATDVLSQRLTDGGQP